jgi:hypothetical protein
LEACIVAAAMVSLTPMSLMTSLLLVFFALWVLANAKTSRPDGTLVRGLHPYRRLMGYIMPGRNESIVYFDSYADSRQLLDYLAEARKRFDCDMTHAVVAACCVCLTENPTVNRFSLGGRLYQRDGVYISFSMKRQQLDRAAKLSVVKIRLQPGETFRALCERINAGIRTERSGERTHADKEFDLFGHLPRPLMRAGVWVLKALDYYNLLPASYIENDPLYTSMFCANLGSLQMDAGFHHLYEYGTCSLFTMAGQIQDRPFVENGRVEIRSVLQLRFTYDERVDDGLNARYGIQSLIGALERPFEAFGCLAEDGSDARPLDQPRSVASTPRASGASATAAA